MEQKEYFFEKLTPNDEVDISVYDEAMEFVFDNSDITNIAISGAYGAGKSSVIESYKKKHTDKKFMHISLAHFESSDIKDETDVIDETMIEGKILNQLIHQIPVSKIPQTNFRVKKEISKLHIFKIAVLFYLMIGSLVFISFSGKIQSFVKSLSKSNLKNVLGFITDKNAVIFAVGVLIVSVFICVYNIVKIQEYKKLFHKVTVQGNSIEIFEDKDDSYFDKYLNEVLYLFEQVGVEGIVFEDIDRFDSNIIFERLREVNNLTNVQKYNKFRKVSNKKCIKLINRILNRNIIKYKPIRFFYLLRDDIFVTKDRTKFFDYIIPIVPVLDGSNSYDQFIRHLKRGKIYEKFDFVFLQRLSLYIDDMRVLKNIYNELLVYINRLNNTDLNWDKMLAIIVYKNIFPRDFCDLQLNKGYVHELFQSKDNISKEEVEQLEEERQRFQRKIDDINNEVLESVDELDAAYEVKYNKLPTDHWYHELTKEAKERKKELEKEKARRKETIEDKNNGRISEYEKKLSELNYEISTANTKLLSELITRYNADIVFMIKSVNPIGEENEYKEIKSSDYFELLKFLISNGYIDETYNDYMTYFYEDSLSAQDKVFLRRITDKKGADYDYKLKDVEKVLSSPILRIVDFYEEETLNFDLLNGLLGNLQNSRYQEYLSVLIKQMKDKKYLDFISRFYDSLKFDMQFIVKLNELWPDFFSYVECNKGLPSEQIRRFSLDTINMSDKEIIQNVNIDNCLTNYISNQGDYLNIQKPDVGKLISSFISLGIKFKTIAYDKANMELFTGVYENDLYELTFENIKLMIMSKYKENNLYSIEHRNYTIIQADPESPLALYVAKNIEKYINEILENCGGIIEDSEEYAIKLVNTLAIGGAKQRQYVEYLTTIISDISSIKDTRFWETMLEEGIVQKTVPNIIYYYEEYSLSKGLIKFINECDVDMDYSLVEKDFGNEIARKFFDAVANNDDIDIEKYENILCSMGYIFDSYETDKISDDRMDILIKNNIIEMNEAGLEYIRSYYSNHILMYIDYNIEKYLDIISSANFDYKEMLHVLDMDIEDVKKVLLLKLTREPVSIIGKNYSDYIMAYIIENNFDIHDENELYNYFSKYNEIIQQAICAVAASRIDNVILDSSIVLDDILLSKLLQNRNCSTDDRISLWAKVLPGLDEETCKKHFDELGFPELKNIFTKRNSFTRVYDKNSYTTHIFAELKKNGWIYDYREKEDDSEKYIVIKYLTRTRR